MMEGLAGQMGQGQGAGSEMVQQVVQLLMQGVSPEELVQQGVPIEVIQEAIAMIQAQEQQEMAMQQPAHTEGGLAMTSGRGM
jgi:ribose 5-phosphate isomerase